MHKRDLRDDDWNPVGGDPALNYGNTVEIDEGVVDVEWLHSYVDVVYFTVSSGLLAPDDADSLNDALRFASGAEHEQLFEQALHLRHTIRQIFAAHAQGEKPSPLDVVELGKWLAQAGQLRKLGLKDGDAQWIWRDQGNLLAPLYRIAWAAAELLTGDHVDQVRQCEAGDCDLLFVDVTRNHSRRWCSMDDCGNRAKARRHYERVKKKKQSAGSG
ncbi:MAG: CGNR zinc finger domain-containing protein [Pleurocapsa minor GSE-CHR-MK-17-07R]|jgi:predicted RNA-binding Zn ribbon-like protein|nr:CGNR zinc finger domain-containing protein [Pleurocapsa minor GSE-CHR-MK 17-07R]